jgi:hypothetical protein
MNQLTKLDCLMNIVVFQNTSGGKRGIWNEKKLTEDERWQEIFRHFKQEDIPLKNIITVVFISARNKYSCGKSVFTGEYLMAG